jgi:alpha-glucan phosphorylase-like protein
LHDPERLLRILTNRQRPVQLVLAGKAHPQDAAGQDMIRQWIEFIRRTPARSQAVFLSDYDMRMTEHLVQGVDLWLNTPRRPWEASGTSGMKILANGGLNLSELDGWWAEAWTPAVGWAIGDGRFTTRLPELASALLPTFAIDSAQRPGDNWILTSHSSQLPRKRHGTRPYARAKGRPAFSVRR